MGALTATAGLQACDLCAIYSADNAGDPRGSGFAVTLSESYIPHHTVQFNGRTVDDDGADFRDSSVTHLVPSYQFSPRFGLNLNLPLVHHRFERTEVRYRPDEPGILRRERGEETGLGDVSLIGRGTVLAHRSMKFSLAVSALAGLKFPTGDTGRIEDEMDQIRIYEDSLPPGFPHDPLGHTVSGVHQHDLSPGTGSFDGVFGLTVTSRWRRWFCNAQAQYYLRTEGESGYRRGDEVLVSGGPGMWLWTGEHATLNLQANAGYDSQARDVLAGRKSDYTGLTAWYLGPQIATTVGERFSAVLGVDLPLDITSNGLQNVPDYRFHASLVWAF